MARTIQDVRVHRGVDDVRNFIAGWLNSNQFQVLEWQARSVEIPYGGFGQRMRLHPRPGSIVALWWGGMTGGAVVFELLLVPEGPSTLVHGEFYAPGASMYAGNEWDVCQNPDAMGKWPRQRGYGQMLSLLQALGGLAGAPPQVAGQTAMPPSSAYQPPQAQRSQRPQGQAPPPGGMPLAAPPQPGRLQVVYCAGCGMSLDAQARFCSRCGRPVVIPTA